MKKIYCYSKERHICDYYTTIYYMWHFHTEFVKRKNLENTKYYGNMSEALGTERQLLKLTQNKTKVILDKGNLDKIIRHKEALETIVKDVEKLKIQGEKAKVKDGVSIEDVQTWGISKAILTRRTAKYCI